MKKALRIIIVLLIAAIYTTSTANAVQQKDVRRSVKAMNHSSKMLLSFKKYPENDGSFQSVFVANGKRYTVYYAGKKANWLSYWVRPEGTHDMNIVKSFTDHGLDGKVEFGIKGDPNRKLLDIHDRNVGRQHQKYWQAEYDQAIADTMNYFFWYEEGLPRE